MISWEQLKSTLCSLLLCLSPSPDALPSEYGPGKCLDQLFLINYRSVAVSCLLLLLKSGFPTGKPASLTPLAVPAMLSEVPTN